MQKTRRFVVTLTIIAIMAVGVAAIACGGSDEPPRGIHGAIVLDDDPSWTVGEPCKGSGGYDDIRGGAQVVVRDASGAVVGTGSLGSGVGDGEGIGRQNRTDECRFLFTVENLPKSDFYSVEVSNRGEMNYSYEELESRRWQVSLSLGD